MNATRIVQLATEMSRAFEGDVRLNGDKFRKLKDGSPEWMTEVIHHAHGEMMPDDHRYAFIEEAVDTLADLDADSATEDDIDNAKEGIQPDIYTGDLMRWLGSRADRYAYVDQHVEDYGEHCASIIGDIQYGQLAERWEVFHLVIEALDCYATQLDIDEEADHVSA